MKNYYFLVGVIVVIFFFKVINKENVYKINQNVRNKANST